MKRIFEFECNSCEETFSKLVDDQTKNVECKLCGSDDTTRKISPTRGFDFRGSGFYETDYR